MLSEMQADLLKEYVNVFIGKSAKLLSEMANQRVLLTVPKVELVNTTESQVTRSHLFKHGHIVSSSMQFGKAFQGNALLIFSAQNAKSLVDSCLGIDVAPLLDESATQMDLLDTDFDVLKEISNILLNAIIGEFSNLVETTVEFTIPDVELLFVGENEQLEYLKKNVYMLLMHTSFTLEKTKVDGVVIVALGMSSLQMLLDKMNAILEVYQE